MAQVWCFWTESSVRCLKVFETWSAFFAAAICTWQHHFRCITAILNHPISSWRPLSRKSLATTSRYATTNVLKSWPRDNWSPVQSILKPPPVTSCLSLSDDISPINATSPGWSNLTYPSCGGPFQTCANTTAALAGSMSFFGHMKTDTALPSLFFWPQRPAKRDCSLQCCREQLDTGHRI